MTEEEEKESVAIPGVTTVLSEHGGEGPPFKISGVAIGPDDITVDKGTKKKWPSEVLKDAVSTLSGRPLVRDHINSTLGNVGEVVRAKFEEGTGVLFEAELDDEELAEKVDNGRLEVSARIKHPPRQELETDEQGAFVVQPWALFDNLSLVNRGASPSNEVQMGAAEMSAEELEEVVEDGFAEGGDNQETEELEEEVEEPEDEVDEVDDEAGDNEGDETEEVEEVSTISVETRSSKFIEVKDDL